MNDDDNEAVKMCIRDWEDKNLCNYNGYVLRGDTSQSIADNMQTRGYDAMRISSRSTTIYGLKYLKMWGASFAPNQDVKNDEDGKYFVKVTWYLQGYIKADTNIKSGITVFDFMVETFNQEYLKKVMGM